MNKQSNLQNGCDGQPAVPVRAVARYLLIGLLFCMAVLTPRSALAENAFQEATTEVPDMTATPLEDGSIYHVVQFGETVSWIANLYGISVEELLAMNYLQDASIYEGQSLKIRGPMTQTPTITFTPTVRFTRTPKPTRTPAPTKLPPTPTEFTTAVPSEKAEATPGPGTPRPYFRDPVFIGIAVLGVAGIVMMIAGAGLKKAGR